MLGRRKSTPVINTNVKPARTVTLTKGNGPAVSLTKAGSVSLTKAYDKVGEGLANAGLAGLRADVMLVLDHSGSMSRDYANGYVQKIVERALGFALQVDQDGKIPVIPFDDRVRKTVEVKLDNYEDIVNRKIWNRRDMGTTNLTAALDVVMHEVKKAEKPIILIIVTDGSPNDQRSALERFIELANYPVWIKCLAIREVPFLAQVDDLEVNHPGRRLLDNVDAKYFDGDTRREGHLATIDQVTDEEFAAAMLDEFPDWVKAATAAGLLTQ